MRTPAEAGAPSPSRWSSQLTFLAAAIGAAVGLGNLWRFPFQAGQNGGSAFVFIYILCVFLIAAPILMAELAIGRSKRRSAVGSPAALARDAGASPAWGGVGLIGLIASFLVLTTYSAVAGQIMAYALMAFGGAFASEETASVLPLYRGDLWPVFWFSLFLLLNVIIVARGLRAGIERLVNIAMPLFFLLLAGLGAYALATGAAGAALTYLFEPRFDEITADVALAALGQAFYSVAVGTGAMLTFGAFLDDKENVATNSAIIVSGDTLVALLAGIMIFPVVFASGLDPAVGMGLIFDALPRVFAGMPGGALIGGAFFVLAFLAALTSSISMLLIATVFASERLGWSAARASYVLGAAAWVIGVIGITAHGMAEAIDFLAGNVALPIAAFGASVFAGWIVPRDVMRAQMRNLSARSFAAWRFLVRWLCPLAVGAILVLGLAAKLGG